MSPGSQTLRRRRSFGAWWWLLAWLTLLGAPGCGPLKSEMKRPEVLVKGVSLTRVGATSADAEFRLALHNPNSFALPVHGVDYDLSLNSRRVLFGDSKQELRLPANGSGEIPLAVTFEYQRIFDSLSSALAQRRVVYQLTGSVGIGPFRVPFASGGEFGLE